MGDLIFLVLGIGMFLLAASMRASATGSRRRTWPKHSSGCSWQSGLARICFTRCSIPKNSEVSS